MDSRVFPLQPRNPPCPLLKPLDHIPFPDRHPSAPMGAGPSYRSSPLLTLTATTLASNRLLRVMFNLSWVLFLSTWKWWDQSVCSPGAAKGLVKRLSARPPSGLCMWSVALPFTGVAPHSWPLASPCNLLSTASPWVSPAPPPQPLSHMKWSVCSRPLWLWLQVMTGSFFFFFFLQVDAYVTLKGSDGM